MQLHIIRENIQIRSIKFVIQLLKLIKIYAKNSRLEIEHKSDLPARSGIGSSSSFTVGLMNAFLSKNKQISKNYYPKKQFILSKNT